MSFFAARPESALETQDSNLLFTKGDVVEFQCVDFKEKADKDLLVVTCKVLTGEYAGKTYAHFIRYADNPGAKRVYASFMLAFWSREDVTGGTVNPARLMGRRFSAVAQQVREHQGKQYQNFMDFKDLGEGEPLTLDDGQIPDDLPY